MRDAVEWCAHAKHVSEAPCIDCLRERAEAAEAERDALRSAARHYLHARDAAFSATEISETRAALHALAWPPGAPAESPRAMVTGTVEQKP